MHVHAIVDPDLSTSGHAAALAEEIGFDGVWVTETAHDPFLPLVPVTLSTSSILLGTAVAVALPRSPTHLAMTAADLQRASSGRFVLGLGSQVRAHVERRFSAAFDHPVSRMRELVGAVRSIWGCWERDEPLAIDGEFYRIDLMPPTFSPAPHGFGDPPIYLSAVGERMAELAGEIADGVLVHGFSTVGYLRDVTLPAVRRGAERAGRDAGDVTLARPVFVVTGRDDAEMAANAAGVRRRLGFYGSTPAYRSVLEHEGWTELGDDLRRLVRAGRWGELGDPIDDAVLAELAIVAPIDGVAGAIVDRFSGVVDRLSFNVPYLADPEVWARVLADVHAATPQKG
ncbi:MAG: TIGR03617 family F420-dependent LLM class oxidoreductase [Actinobacteria bacterium]|nr:TIGR03617 family F420-dependent LLM class oxidoreductase [Actinomycetota bacterium]